ncbi:hypothetical protein SDC9_118884 [bioreactor metagenome]|uniref:Polysaccharide pyruvyl transferase domain-containing protein n=1 Tax=bioreactor metagenome TaxID=1076179 RepID=A0A645C8D5_9ZZZZ
MGISMRVQKACGGGIIAKELTAGELIAVLKRMEFVVGMRLHILIYASAAGKNAIGIAYDPKIRDFLEYIDSSFCVMAESFTANELTEMSEDIIIHKNEYEQKLTGRVRELKKLAVRDARTAAEFVPAKD